MSDQAVFLLVDDNEGDVLLVRRAFVKAKVLNPLQVIPRGMRLLRTLRALESFQNVTSIRCLRSFFWI